MPVDWSTEEIEVIVAEYFAMLRAELAGLPYTKSAHNERARRLSNNRSKASVETAVLEWLEGKNDLVEVVRASLFVDPPRLLACRRLRRY